MVMGESSAHPVGRVPPLEAHGLPKHWAWLPDAAPEGGPALALDLGAPCIDASGLTLTPSRPASRWRLRRAWRWPAAMAAGIRVARRRHGMAFRGMGAVPVPAAAGCGAAGASPPPGRSLCRLNHNER